MTDTNVFRLSQPRTFSDPLTEVLRNGARVLLAQAVEAEVAALLAGHADKLTDDGRQRLVRHGHLPEREIMTGIGPVAVRTTSLWKKPAARIQSAGIPGVRAENCCHPRSLRRPGLRESAPDRGHGLPAVALRHPHQPAGFLC